MLDPTKREGKALARTFASEPGGWMRIKTYGPGGRLMSERIVPEWEGRQIMRGYRPKEPMPGPTLGNVD